MVYETLITYSAVPAYIAASMTALAVFGIMKRIDMMIPPAAAIAILAFLMPADALLFFRYSSCLVSHYWLVHLIFTENRRRRLHSKPEEYL